MAKGLSEKLFFLEHIPVDVLLDYGCADGALVEDIRKISNFECLGYDFDTEMIRFAKQRGLSDAHFSTNLPSLLSKLPSSGEADSVVLCSSLIHEVYSYGTKASISQFWSTLFSGQFKYVVIRDMALSKEVLGNTVDSDLMELMYKFGDRSQLEDFVRTWGSFSNRVDVIHFLMKYRYTQNWDREVRENYFPLTVEDYEKIIPPHFKVIYREHKSLPFIRNQVLSDFKIDIAESTHLKLILERRA